MKKCLPYILILTLSVFKVHSQTHHIAVFLPLYLDSAFDKSGNYKFNETFPKFINPGLEFYEGAQLALDSLKAEGAHLDVHIYDTRSTANPVSKVLSGPEFQNTELILGYVNHAEMQLLANVALHKNIPFINVNWPNDGNIRNNPDFVLLNSTIKTHFESIYRFLQKNYGASQIIVLRKKGAMEDRIKNYFTDIQKNSASTPVTLKYVDLTEPVLSAQLLPYLDSTKQNIFLAGSFDENFARNICSQLSGFGRSYPVEIVGMPTWDNIDFSDAEYRDINIIYTTPFLNDSSNTVARSIQEDFKTKFYSRPSDMVFRGYETTYHFAKLLQQYGDKLNGNVVEKKYNPINDFEIEPVFTNKQNPQLDYFENKKIYFIKMLNGSASSVN
ncbi:MAG: amino acid ABC transporter substrate-binding protein [Bacteroidetes bacterium]|nr:amino acid ABC transporter substrate-binding protein [Bacteroidota bacterium]